MDRFTEHNLNAPYVPGRIVYPNKISDCKIGQSERCQGGRRCEWKRAFNINCSELKEDPECLAVKYMAPLPTNPRNLKSSKRKKQPQPPILTPSKRMIVYERGGGICYLCGEPVEYNKMTLEHVIPKAKGGTNKIENLRPAHGKCNFAKGSKDLEEFLSSNPDFRNDFEKVQNIVHAAGAVKGGPPNA